MDGASSDSGEDGQNHAQRMICVDAVSSPTGCLRSTVWRATWESDRLLYLEVDAVSQTPLLG